MRKVILNVNDSASSFSESVWADEVEGDGLFQLRNIPASAKGYAENDVVRVKTVGDTLEVVEIVKDSGNATFWIDFEPSERSVQNSILDELKSVNCEFERFTDFIVGVTVPPSLDVPFGQLIGYLRQEVDKKAIKGWMLAKDRGA